MDFQVDGVDTDSVEDYSLSIVPVPLVDVLWGQVVPHLQKVVDRSHGELTLESVKARIKNADTLLVTISRGGSIVAINTLELRIFDSGKRAMFIPITGGSELDGWMPDFLALAKTIAREHNCSELRGLAVRPGWMKKLEPHGWENVHMVISCAVEESE